MQWRKLARTKITSGRSRTRNMLCCGRSRKDNGREALDLTASPMRVPSAQQTRNNHPPPMVIQGDFRKVSGISSEIFKQIETVENDHDASTAAALEHVERRGEMIVRILDSRHLGRSGTDAAKRFTAMQDSKHTVQFVEIVKRPGQTLGLYIREGNGIDRSDGVFISRIALESAVYNSGCLKVGDEILAVNLVDVTRMSLDDVVIIMSIPRRLVLATRQRKGGGKGGQGSPGVQPRAEHKPPPVVVIKRDLREDDADDKDPLRQQRHTGDGREMSESRSRLGLGLAPSSADSRASSDSNGLDLYYNSRPPDSGGGGGGGGACWGYQPPPPPVITEQPKPNVQHFQPYEKGYPNTLESLAEKVHAFGLPPPPPAGRRMSAGQPPPPRMAGRDGAAPSHYYVQHAGTGSRRMMPRSGSDQHLPHTEYSEYATGLGQAGRHSLLRSSLKSGSTLSRYNQRYADAAAAAVAAAAGQMGPSKYAAQYGAAATLTRRNRSSLDYSSDTEATLGPRSGYYYYSRSQAAAIPHSTIPTLGRNNSMTSTDLSTKFNSLPRDTRGTSRLGMTKRFGDRTVSLLQDDADGNLSAPEMPSIRQRDEYRQWLSRTPSTSAIYEQIRASRDVLNQQRAARFTYSAENIHAALKDTDGGYYSSYRPGATSTLDRHFTRTHQAVPARSMSSQHITGSTSALASTRSPSMRRMRQLLELDAVRAGAPSPVPTPSGTLPRGQRQLDINPAEFLKYKVDKTGTGALSTLAIGPGGQLTTAAALEEPVSGMLWVHLLAGRGLRASTGTSTATTPVTPSGGPPTIQGSSGLRDLYCVLECDRVHKARTVVRTGDLIFDWDESFELDLVNNRELDLLIYSWDPQYRHKLCYKGSVHLPSLLKSGPLHQLALKIEPRGTLYIRLRHADSHSLYKRRGLSNLTLSRTQPLFGVDLETVVNREGKTGGVPAGLASSGQQIPVIVRRCVEEVERRGLDIIGLYRLCGSATKKRILREAFERNSRSVDLTPDNVPDINVITGVLKDYLRELPEPLFTKCLYQMMVDALGVCLPDDPEGNAKLMFSILDCLPRINRATLIFLMDHLALVVSASDRNKMSAQNLAIALAPPLMLHSSMDAATSGLKSELDYTQPISVLKYLLQIWPVPKHHSGRRAKPPGPRGDSRSASQAGSSHHQQAQQHQQQQQLQQQHQASHQQREPSRGLAAQFPLPLRSAALGQRGPLPQGPLQQTLGPSSASRGPYRPLSPRVGPPPVAVSSALRPRQVIVSSPGSPSSSSGDSQSGSDSVKHCLPQGARGAPPASPKSLSRGASPSAAASRSGSPAMQSTSAGLAVTMATTAPSFASLAGLHTTVSAIGAPDALQPAAYSSTNPFLTGAYLQYAPGEAAYHHHQQQYHPKKPPPPQPFSFAEVFGAAAAAEHHHHQQQQQKYATLNAKASYDGGGGGGDRFNTIGPERFLGDLSKFAPKGAPYETSPSGQQSQNLLAVEDTPTPTSSIETEDSVTREVGEKDVEGDGEQSD